MTRHKEKPVQTNSNELEEAGFEPETESLAPTVDELQDEIERLRTELAEAQQKVNEEHEQYLRSLADFSNFRKRNQEELKQSVQFASQDMILAILPAIDNFERALESAEQGHNFESLVEGVKLTLRQLQSTLEREDVKPIEAIGQEFDPMIHEAVMRVDTDEYPENTIVDELQKGYTFRGRVIRPSRVRVAVPAE